MTEYVLTNADYDELDRYSEESAAVSARAGLMQSHPDGDDVTIQPVPDGEGPFDPTEYTMLHEAMEAASNEVQEEIAIDYFDGSDDEPDSVVEQTLEQPFDPSDYDDVDEAVDAASNRHESRAAVLHFSRVEGEKEISGGGEGVEIPDVDPTEYHGYDPSEYDTLWDAMMAAESHLEAEMARDHFVSTPAGADETVHNMRTDEGASVSVSITRGEGTRDQEKWKMKGKGADAQQAVEELVYQLEAVVGEVSDEPLADQVRQFQPGDGDD